MGLANKPVQSEKDALACIIGTLFMNRTIAHMAHLKTGSFAVHKALDSFYNDVVEHADKLAEVSQGIYGKMDIPFVGFSGDVKNPVDMLETELRQLESCSAALEKDFLKNIFQEIQSLYRQTIYLLKELA